MASFEFVITAFLAIALTASIISSRTRAPYTIILVLFGVAIAGSSLSSILSVNLLYDSLIGGGLFVGLVLPPLLFETMMNIRYEEFRAVFTPAIRLATIGVVIATIVGGLLLWQIAAAEALGVSGLVAVSVAGLYYGNTTIRTWVRPQTTRTVRNFWRIMTFIANSLAFLYIGLSTNLASIRADLVPIGIAFSAVIIARLSTVYSLLGISHVDGEPIPRSWKNVAFLGGMRGALSIALVASLKSCAPTPVAGCVPQLDLITSMVLGVAFLSIILQGFLLSRYIRKNFPKRTAPRGVQALLTSGK